MIEDTFDDVLVAAQGGDELAFAHLWRSVNPRLVGYLRTLAPTTAADVASETWIQVIRTGLDCRAATRPSRGHLAASGRRP
jgi:DNA-directed RNA polymerase specialized sigma24 family protein